MSKYVVKAAITHRYQAGAELISQLYPPGQKLVDSSKREIAKKNVEDLIRLMLSQSMFYKDRRMLAGIMNSVFGSNLSDPALYQMINEFDDAGMDLPSNELIYLPEIDLANCEYNKLNMAAVLYSADVTSQIMLFTVPDGLKEPLMLFENDIKDESLQNYLQNSEFIPINASSTGDYIVIVDESKWNNVSEDEAKQRIGHLVKMLKKAKMLSPLGIKDVKRLEEAVIDDEKHDYGFGKGENSKKRKVEFKATRRTSAKSELDFINKAIKNAKRVMKSDNKQIFIKSSYKRASRRHPDDINAIGHLIKIKYKPDIHIYVDTSGSISHQMYQDSLTMIAKVAKKMNIKLTISSFADNVTKSVSFTTHYLSNLKKLPVITGGTDFKAVWDDIDERNNSNELNFIITDYGYAPYDWHADRSKLSYKNTYYIAVKSDSIEPDYFSDSMIMAGAFDIRRYMLI